MTRPSYRYDDRPSSGSARSGGPIGWLQSLWGKRAPSYRSQTKSLARRSTAGLFAPPSPDYRQPECTPVGDQCCLTTCGPCKTFATPMMTTATAVPTELQGPVTIIVGAQE